MKLHIILAVVCVTIEAKALYHKNTKMLRYIILLFIASVASMLLQAPSSWSLSFSSNTFLAASSPVTIVETSKTQPPSLVPQNQKPEDATTSKTANEEKPEVSATPGTESQAIKSQAIKPYNMDEVKKFDEELYGD